MITQLNAKFIYQTKCCNFFLLHVGNCAILSCIYNATSAFNLVDDAENVWNKRASESALELSIYSE